MASPAKRDTYAQVVRRSISLELEKEREVVSGSGAAVVVERDARTIRGKKDRGRGR